MCYVDAPIVLCVLAIYARTLDSGIVVPLSQFSLVTFSIT